MRATLLFVLSAVLIWFVWHSLDKGDGVEAADPNPSAQLVGANSSDATSAPANPLVPTGAGATGTSAGETLPAQSTQAATIPTPERPASTPATSEAKVAVVAEAPPASRPVAVSIPAPGAAGTSRTRTSEADLARALVSDPAGFSGVLERSETPTGARRTWAVALGQALSGETGPARDALERLSSEPEVKSGERECLARLLDASPVHVASASAVAESPLTRAAYLVAQSRVADSLRAANQHRAAVVEYSELLLAYVNAPWKCDPAVLRRWTDALVDSQRFHRWNRAGEWPSVSMQVKPGDNLIGVRKRAVAEHERLLVCTGQILVANELRSSTLQPGQTLRIPTDRARMLVDLDAHWAFYLLGDEVAAAWEIGVGKPGNETQVGNYLVGTLQKDPTWFRPGHDPVPYGDPQNALGTRWIEWVTPDGKSTGLGFHGTNEPDSIGRDASQGCIRMRNADVERLYEILPKGAEVRVQP